MHELVIHIGMGKAASTTIQKNVLLHADAPIVISRHKRERDDSIGLKPMWWRGLCSTKKDQVEEAKKILKTHFLPKNTKMVLSDEVIAGSPHLAINLVRNLRDICLVKVLLVTRKQDDFLASLYNHGMRSRVVAFGVPRLHSEAISSFIYRGGYSQWIEQLIESHRLGDKNILSCISYYSVYKDLSEVIGEEQTILLPFELLKHDPKKFIDKMANIFGMDEQLCFELMTSKGVQNKTGERVTDYYGGNVLKNLMSMKMFVVFKKLGFKRASAEKLFASILSMVSKKQLVTDGEKKHNVQKIHEVFEKNNRLLDDVLEYEIKGLGYYEDISK